MITWQNTITGKTGTVADMETFNRLQKFVGGGLKVLKQTSPETDDLVNSVIEDAPKKDKRHEVEETTETVNPSSDEAETE
jgi:hypothetical protein